MKIEELKSLIETKSVPDKYQIWLMKDTSSFIIARQYIKQIAKDKNLTVKYIDSFDEVASQGFVEDENLYIYKVDQLKEFKEIDNLIVICNKGKHNDIIEFPKLEHWQFIDYAVTIVPGMDRADLEWLITQYEYTYDRVTATNYDRLLLDLDKIAIFPESMQNSLFNELYNSGEYDTVSSLTIFDLSNALIKRNPKEALQVLKVFDYIDSMPHVWLLSILLGAFKNVVSCQLNPKITAADLGISDKQFYVVNKFNLGYYSKEELIQIYDVLTNAEYMYKFGGITQEMLADYLIVKILGV